jgi:hypothetical protein
MNLDEAFGLMRDKDGMAYDAENVPTVTIKRNGTTWEGKVVGIVTHPSLILETPATRVAIALNGSVAYPREER